MPKPAWQLVLDRTLIGDDCWLYQGALTKKGHYARVRPVVDGKMTSVMGHRAVYEALVGPIPEGMTLDHVKEKCAHKHCVRPDHLEPCEAVENWRRGSQGAVAQRRAQTHCGKGHLLVTMSSGRRRCRECHAERERRRYSKVPVLHS